MLKIFIVLNYNFYNIIQFKKDFTEKVLLVVLHGLATFYAWSPLVMVGWSRSCLPGSESLSSRSVGSWFVISVSFLG